MLTDSRHPVGLSRTALYWWIRTGGKGFLGGGRLAVFPLRYENVEGSMLAKRRYKVVRASALTLVSVRSRAKAAMWKECELWGGNREKKLD